MSKKISQAERKALLELGSRRLQETAAKIAEWRNKALREEVAKVKQHSIERYADEVEAIKEAHRALCRQMDALWQRVEDDGLIVGHIRTSEGQRGKQSQHNFGTDRSRYGRNPVWWAVEDGLYGGADERALNSPTSPSLGNTTFIERQIHDEGIQTNILAAVAKRQKAEKVPTYDDLDAAWVEFEEATLLAQITGEQVADLLKSLPTWEQS